MSRLKLLTAFLIILICGAAKGQAIKAVEKDLISTFIDQKAYHDSVNELIRHDSLKLFGMLTMVHIDSLCVNKMLYYTSKFPQTIGMEFKSLRTQDINIMTSDDSLFRIYVWNERRVLAGPAYKSVFQFKTNDEVKSCVLPHPDTALSGAGLAFFDGIYTIVINSKTYYLTTYLNRYNPTMREEGIKVFTIDKGVLNDTVHIIKTKTGLHNELSYKYDVIASGDAGSDNGIVYDTADTAIQIPVVLEGGKMTARHITYKFKGQYFEKLEGKKDESGEGE
ncbi:MAG TPA: hypothetical protein VK783_12635 [Bacteroidia bacterium]|jgi:hypothetical protein|nr:hypothetical protein [Bacteroidia bacterium]